jgi:hypothetical protein
LLDAELLIQEASSEILPFENLEVLALKIVFLFNLEDINFEKFFCLILIEWFLLRFRGETLKLLILILWIKVDSGNETNPDLILLGVAFDKTEISSVETLVDADPLILIEVNPIVGTRTCSILVNSSHLSKFHKLQFVAEDRTQTFDALSYVNFFEGLNIDITFDVFIAGGGENSERVALPGEIYAFVDQTHANRSLHASFHSDLPKAGVTGRRLETLVSHFLVTLIFIRHQPIFIGALILLLLSSHLNLLQLLSLVKFGSQRLFGVVLVFMVLDFCLLIIRLLLVTASHIGHFFDKLVFLNVAFNCRYQC